MVSFILEKVSMEIERKTKEEVKAYYIEQLGKFLAIIADIPNDEIRKLPAVHIPILGFPDCDEMPEIAFYGMETNTWGSMLELRNSYIKDPESAYRYITEVFNPHFVIDCARPRQSIFFKYVIALLAGIYGFTPKQIKNEVELKKHLFIWGNIMSLERYNVSAKSKGVKWETFKKAYDASAILNRLPNGNLGPTYIVRACRPKLLFILYWDFNLGNWIKNEFGIDKDKIQNHLYYCHIEETDTHVFKMPHPVFINRCIGWHKSINEVLERLKINRQIAESNH